MPLRRPEAYRQALRDSREVYMWGERVADVTSHAGLCWAVETASLDYAMAQRTRSSASWRSSPTLTPTNP